MKDVCKRGHKLSGDNVSMQIGGNGKPYKMCRQCNRDRAKLWRQKNAPRLGRKKGQGLTDWPGQTLICR